ncbi:16S rRNA (guanine(527)-N(7))-methyltransferase RsmG [Marininema halotolerans]|uniref:Ribosomal RNA small subunit methyltransferase G n=1 Tax=Marininema halotolerans TaxID=1155944 RepID=A0A1I6PAU2_9BACL|nr:16S rRNA (guanine(527)-N(7))-methyltransferase RsmG [Marininema halotolerans]SFS37324.1 16S rRNA (guanine527-N7)-methyltransferase [Marininema halotolerans]
MDRREWLQEAAASHLHIALDAKQLDQFEIYLNQLLTVNQHMNLTAITEEKEVYIKHFYDSLSLAAHVEMKEITSMMDVGTGAGFPGLALKIAFPHIRLVLLDSLQKRVNFLREVADACEMKEVEALHGRAEEVGRQSMYRETFDLVTARAVAKLNVLSEYCLPFVKVGGHFVAMKGPDIQEELSMGKRAVTKLGGRITEEHVLALPEEKGERSIILVQKTSSTPKAYPRKAGTPQRNPL